MLLYFIYCVSVGWVVLGEFDRDVLSMSLFFIMTILCIQKLTLLDKKLFIAYQYWCCIQLQHCALCVVLRNKRTVYVHTVIGIVHLNKQQSGFLSKLCQTCLNLLPINVQRSYLKTINYTLPNFKIGILHLFNVT